MPVANQGAEFFAKDRPLKQPTVLIIDGTMLEHVDDVLGIAGHVIIVGANSASDAALGERADISLVDASAAPGQGALRAACLLSVARLRLARQHRQTLGTRRELYELNRVGMALMLERDEKVLAWLLHRAPNVLLIPGTSSEAMVRLDSIVGRG